MSEKYLIFGATGSIGSSLAEQLKNSGKNIHLVARNKSEVQLNINSFDYDIDNSVLDEYISFTEKIKNHIGSNPDMWNAVSEYR